MCLQCNTLHRVRDAEPAVYLRLYRRVETLGHVSLAWVFLHSIVQSQHAEQGSQAEFQYADSKQWTWRLLLWCCLNPKGPLQSYLKAPKLRACLQAEYLLCKRDSLVPSPPSFKAVSVFYIKQSLDEIQD